MGNSRTRNYTSLTLAVLIQIKGRNMQVVAHESVTLDSATFEIHECSYAIPIACPTDASEQGNVSHTLCVTVCARCCKRLFRYLQKFIRQYARIRNNIEKNWHPTCKDLAVGC